MPLVENGQIVQDRYRYAGDEEPIPGRVPVIVPAQRFLIDTDALIRRDGSLGVLWPNDRRIAELAPWLGHLALVALQFPKFRDGRAYSQARLLRETYGFRGTLRATGDVLRDQFHFLIRARLRLFRGEEAGGRHRVCASRQPLQRGLSADRGRPCSGVAATRATSRSQRILRPGQSASLLDQRTQFRGVSSRSRKREFRPEELADFKCHLSRTGGEQCACLFRSLLSDDPIHSFAGNWRAI